MKALVIFVNGDRICSIAMAPDQIRHVDISWIGGPEIFLGAGGMEDRDHVDWEMPDLKIGDEVCVKVIECDETNPPTRRRTNAEVDAWARSLKPKTERERRLDDEMPRLPAPWE